MKVIGKKDSSTYICEVDHFEIEKVMSQYHNNLERLEVNDEIDLGIGYDFKREVKDMLHMHKEVLERSAKVIQTITNGISFLAIEKGEN